MVSSKEYIDKEVSDYPYFNTLRNSNNSIEFKSRFAIKRTIFINKLSKTFQSSVAFSLTKSILNGKRERKGRFMAHVDNMSGWNGRTLIFFSLEGLAVRILGTTGFLISEG